MLSTFWLKLDCKTESINEEFNGIKVVKSVEFPLTNERRESDDEIKVDVTS